MKRILAVFLGICLLFSMSTAFASGRDFPAKEEKNFRDVTIGDILDAFSNLEAEYFSRLLDYIRSGEAASFLDELQTALKKTAEMSDEEVLEQIDRLSEEYNVKLTEKQKEQLLKFCRSLEGLDAEELRNKIETVGTLFLEKAGIVMETLEAAMEKSSGFLDKARSVFQGIGDFVAGLFKR